MNKQLSHMESNQAQKKFPLALVADGLQSPANVGSLFRVCEAFGIEKIYFCNSRINFDSPRLKKTARNTQDNVPFSIEANTLDKVKELKKKGIYDCFIRNYKFKPIDRVTRNDSTLQNSFNRGK